MTTLVIGAGVVGGAAAQVCLDAVVLSAGDGHGGRMETRTHGGVTYDIGTTCIPDAGDERSTVVRELLGPDCTAFEGRIELLGGDPGRVPRPRTRLTGRHGVEQVPELLRAARHIDGRLDTTVERVEQTDDGWLAHTDDGTVEGDRLVTATGAERTADLLAGTELATDIWRAADRVDHRTVDSVVLGYDHPVDRDWYALAADETPHDIRWLGRESAKPGHVPEEQAALVVRLGDDWASSHGPDAAVDRAREAAASLLDEDRLADPSWTDHERYRYARPFHHVDPSLVRMAERADCYLAGDWVAGTDRTFAPLETGLDAGRRAMDFAQQASLQPDGPVEG